MKRKNILLIVLFMFLTESGLFTAEKGKVVISEPKENAMVDAKNKVMIMYEVSSGPEGDHIHLMVDNKRVNLLRELKGHTDVGPLNIGKHKICLVVNTKSHMPTGVEGCVNVTAK